MFDKFRATITRFLSGNIKTLTDKPEKFSSRRYISMWRLTWLVTVLFVLPPVAAFVLLMLGISKTASFAILGEATFTTLLTLIWGSYLMSDYHTKKLQNGNAAHSLPVPETKEPFPEEDK